jgi:hypothetical protein
MTHPPAFRFFGPTEKALYLSRPNRFVLTCKLGGLSRLFCQPGNLELLLPEIIYIRRPPTPTVRFATLRWPWNERDFELSFTLIKPMRLPDT